MAAHYSARVHGFWGAHRLWYAPGRQPVDTPRPTPDRRKHARVIRPFEGSWQGRSGQAACRIGDISLGGCFVQSEQAPEPGEEAVVTVAFSADHSMSFRGHVVYVESGIGFAVRFREMTPEDHESLRRLLAALYHGTVSA
jgi:hypothetical protein